MEYLITGRFRRTEKGDYMRIFRSGKKQLLAFFMPGFFLGLIYVNFIAKKYMAEPGIFSSYFMERFSSVKVETGEYLLYLLRIRLTPLLLLAAVSFTRLRRLFSVLFLIWTGFSAGLLSSMAAAGLGIVGSLLCITALFPQFLFYIPAYTILLWYCYDYPGCRWNRQKTVFLILMTGIGIMMELYVNPAVIRGFLSVFRTGI